MGTHETVIFLFLTGNTLFWANLVQKFKIVSLRILKGEKALSNKTQALTKSRNMEI